MSVEWKFRIMTRGEINVDPIEGEFFTTEALRVNMNETLHPLEFTEQGEEGLAHVVIS